MKYILILIVIALLLFVVKKKNMSWRQSVLRLTYPLAMKAENHKRIITNKEQKQPVVSFYSLHATVNNGSDIDFNSFRGKKVLLVNTASDCGYTPQYDDLEKIYRQYGDHLVVLGFPANDFKEQEQKNDAEIEQFCKVNFGVTFPLIRKSHVVKGDEQNAVFRWLSDASQNGWCNTPPSWNFCKYLVDEKGILVAFYASAVSPAGAAMKKDMER